MRRQRWGEAMNQVTESRFLPVCLTESGELEFMVGCGIFVAGGPRLGELRRIIHAGMRWDGATIPRLFWRIIGHPLAIEFRWASLWHDILCVESQTLRQRNRADSWFLFLLSQETSLPRWRRVAMFLAVRGYSLTVWNFGRFIPRMK